MEFPLPAPLSFPCDGCRPLTDLAHNTTKLTDPAGNVIDDVFDVLNRNTSRTVTRATGFLGTTSETRSFDPLTRLREIRRARRKFEWM